MYYHRENKSTEAIKKKPSKRYTYIKVAVAMSLCVAFGFYIAYVHVAVEDMIAFMKLDVTPWKVVLVLLGAAGSVGFLTYLQPAQGERVSAVVTYAGSDISEAIVQNKNQLKYLEEKFESFLSGSRGVEASAFLDESEKQELKKLLVKRLEEENQVNLIAGIESRIFEKWKISQAQDIYSKTVNRLERELLDQARRGNVNLLLGIFTTLTGVGVLGYSVFQAPVVQNSMELTSHFLPRLSLVVLIEVFAYFFLRLYKQGLAEIKYFQNEITNIESKYLALNVSVSCGVDEGLLKAIDKLLLTERNFILEKGQSTVELQVMKSERSRDVNLSKRLMELIAALKKD